MKILVVLNAKGRVAGTLHRHSLPSGVQIGVTLGRGQTAREIEIAEEHAKLAPSELHALIQSKHLGKKQSAPRGKVVKTRRASSTTRKK